MQSDLQSKTNPFDVQAKLATSEGVRNESMQNWTYSGKSEKGMARPGLSFASCSHQSSASLFRKQGARKEGGLDVWLGRLAMIGFAVAIGVEVSTGKGLLENFGLTSPLPTAALGVTALVGVLTAVFIFQSGSEK
ncbi:hypothetical protein C1H46_024141 [Malus baccata]|uniref:Stress enhanced protein 1 n=1 Tax=Malus baccata TaxID=106549 RepID=A0A540LUY5_MALBA|nr:hypothetical protein C1H46_024141 [Malus baccata]